MNFYRILLRKSIPGPDGNYNAVRKIIRKVFVCILQEGFFSRNEILMWNFIRKLMLADGLNLNSCFQDVF